ncbi:MAG: DNA translocase FtsK 4TM domain-containing protein [Thermoflexaceae bacterium]|nr:DNA translocase FtsK 4TM domain-containing protein [Thermoflexaceae bacterium]
MASKSNSKGKVSSKGRTTSGRKKTSTKKKSNPIVNEIVLLLLIGFVILLFLSLIGVCGTAGDVISKPIFGLFGMLGYVFPFVLAVGIFILVANNCNGAAKIKTFGLALAFVAVSGLFNIMDNRIGEEMVLKDIYAECAARHIGGGAAGGVLNKVLEPFGFGAVVIICILIIVGLVILTERSFINGVKEQGTKVYNKTRENIESYKTEAEEKQTKRMEKKASGVVMDTIIPRDGIKHGDVREINEKVSKQTDKYSDDIFEIKPIDVNKQSEKDRITTVEDVVSHADNKKDNTVIPYIDRVVADSMPEEDVMDSATEKPEKATEHKPVQETVNKPEQATGHMAEHPDELSIKETQTEVQTYKYPPIDLLNKITAKKNVNAESENRETARTLQQTLQSFGVNVTVTDVSCGPSVTRYELLPERGTKVSKIVSLADDIKLNLAAADIRIEAPIPGKAAVGIEVPNKESTGVGLRELLESDEFKNHPSKIAFAAGKDIAGKVIVADIAKMPHLLIAGATGSGKSVCINTIIMSILYKARPDEVKLIMVDPKVVELSMYNSVPHLLIPVVTDPKKASQALNWAVAEMESRYKKFAEVNVRDLKGYNEKVEAIKDIEDENKPKKLPQIVIIIDELADLMMVAPGEVEDAICRLAQLARACGIHLIIATQRPSVNVITGLIKANVPSRIAFSVSSGVDSRTILDMNGAEKLLGKGDMLFYPSGYQKPVRAQGAFVSDKEVANVVDFLASNQEPAAYNEEIISAVNNVTMEDSQAFGGERDQYFAEAGRFVIEKERASIGLIQRFYKVGFNRAARIMDQLADAGVVGPEEGTKPRKILMTMEEFEEFLNSGK